MLCAGSTPPVLVVLIARLNQIAGRRNRTRLRAAALALTEDTHPRVPLAELDSVRRDASAVRRAPEPSAASVVLPLECVPCPKANPIAPFRMACLSASSWGANYPRIMTTCSLALLPFPSGSPICSSNLSGQSLTVSSAPVLTNSRQWQRPDLAPGA
jgi:hypothetical protein